VVYSTILDCSTGEFMFHVGHVKVVDQPSEAVNAFTVLRKAQTLKTLVLPPSRDTMNMTVDDILHNDVRLWLERKGVEWSMIDVKSQGQHTYHSLLAFTLCTMLEKMPIKCTNCALKVAVGTLYVTYRYL